MIVTTTGNLEGYEIKEYINTVSAHYVTGTNVFSDWLAGWSDFFGGQSKSYTNELQKIERKVLNQLEKNAKQIGANAILGLRIDHDQISGKSNQMFMLTAMGTAAFVKKVSVTENESGSKAISSRHLNDHLTCLEIIKKINSKEILEEKELDLISEANFVFLFAPLISFYARMHDYYYNHQIDEEKFKLAEDKIFQFISNLPYEIIKKEFYKNLELKSLPYTELENFFARFELLDFEKIAEIVKNKDLEVSVNGLKLISACDKPNFNSDDIDQIDKLISTIESRYVNLSKLSSKKSTFSSKEKTVWICNCSHENSESTIYCNNCKKDKLGFNKNDEKPGDVVSHLSQIKAIISTYL